MKKKKNTNVNKEIERNLKEIHEFFNTKSMEMFGSPLNKKSRKKQSVSPYLDFVYYEIAQDLKEKRKERLMEALYGQIFTESNLS